MLHTQAAREGHNAAESNGTRMKSGGTQLNMTLTSYQVLLQLPDSINTTLDSLRVSIFLLWPHADNFILSVILPL